MSNQYMIVLRMGDYYNDGHGKHEDVIFTSDRTKDEIIELYVKATSIVGFDFESEVANEYGEPYIKLKLFDKLKQYLPDELITRIKYNPITEDEDGEGYYLEPETYYQLWYYFIKTADNDFKLELLNPTYIDIGGYGLFE